eukprot:scaffold7500_cov127-Isochrysis_galbana.AAC.31
MEGAEGEGTMCGPFPHARAQDSKESSQARGTVDRRCRRPEAVSPGPDKTRPRPFLGARAGTARWMLPGAPPGPCARPGWTSSMRAG